MPTSNAETGQPVSPLQLAHPDGIGFVDFRWIQDRFVHRVQIGTLQTETFRTETLAENESTAWPQSPPMQQLSIESIDGRNVALGVGGAGTSHWSLSVEPVENGFRFDWACKTKETPERLATSYQAVEGLSVVADRTSSELQTDLDGSPPATRIIPDEPLSGPGTFRWRYDIIRSS